MKKASLVILILFAQLSTVTSIKAKAISTPQKTSYQVNKKSLQKICEHKKAAFFITYPQVNGLKSKTVENKINSVLSKEFVSNKNAKCADFSQDDDYHEDINFETKLKNENLLSIYYLNIGNLTPSAHPNNVLSAYNFDLKTGQLLKLSDLFKNNSNYKNKLKPLILKSFKKQNFQEDVPEKNGDYDFYLTSKGLVLINFFENHALQGLEANIDYKDIKDILNSKFNIKV